MINNVLSLIKFAASFLPFALFAFFNSKANTKKAVRHRQYPMPFLAVIYSAVLLVFLGELSTLITDLFLKLADVFDKIKLVFIGDLIRDLHATWITYLSLVLFNTAALLVYIILKRIITAILGKIKVKRNSLVGKVVDLFYAYDEQEEKWFIKEHFGQARTFIKAAYYGSCFASGLALLVSYNLCQNHLISSPFYPVFAVIVIGEMAFFIDGLRKDEEQANMTVQTDNSRHIAMYAMLRKPLKVLFGDKLSAEGTTVNNGGISGGAIEDVLVNLEDSGGHIGKNYAAFIRKKMEGGLKPNVDYVRCGYDLSTGKSLLFNTPFYDKLNPYVFYAMNRELLTGGKILIVLGRHGTEDDLQRWSASGMKAVSNIPDLWKIAVLSGKKADEDELPDIGIISRSGVHDLDIHKCNLPFLRKVSFVVLVEPSRLVATAQIGLNLLIKNCGQEKTITFCSVDRNCDGLVDALSHILMTNITEVSATEYPHGMSSYMYWTADEDYLQHRILPGVSRYLGIGTELSLVALKNQVKKAVWYGGEAFPVKDMHWIAKQYYYDLLDYAQQPTTQETFDKCFQTSFNMCDERVSDYSYITVEDDRNNLFETRRNFATIAEEQGFVNVISSEYMLRGYMAANTEMFTADAKAIPYITADYARTKRNAILSLCLLLCIDSVKQEVLDRQMSVLNIDTKDPAAEIWKEICVIFGENCPADKKGNPILTVKNREGKTIAFEKDATIVFKREYSVESGKFESVYTIDNADFSAVILEDLQNASYIAEQESKDVYIGTELKGHVYQKYMPGQFFTINGKYYEMVATATDNRILVRRASEHITGRLAYRQVRNYTIRHLEDSSSMGALKSINNIDVHYQFADFSVDTPGYWKLSAYNDFDNGDLVKVNGVPTRNYHHKQILKIDFSKLGDAFTDSVRMTLTNLLNEVFVTLFADNQPFISAITPGNYDAPLTYSLQLDAEEEAYNKCIFIVEDSQLDIGLLVAVERNISRIFQIILDYLSWNDEQIAESMKKQNQPQEEKPEPFDVYAEEKTEKKGFFGKVGAWFKKLFGKKDKKAGADTEPEAEKGEPEKKGILGKIAGWFKKKEKTPVTEEETPEAEDVPAEEAGQPADDGAETENTPEPEEEPAAQQDGETPEPEEAPAAEENGQPAAQEERPIEEPAAEPAEALTPKQQRKAAKEAARAEKRALREQKKAAKLEAKLLKKQEKAAKKAETEQASAPAQESAEEKAEEASQPAEPVEIPAQEQSEVEVSDDE